MNANQILQSNRFEVEQLLRRYRVLGPANMETIRRAHNQYGENFMMKLLEIVTPRNEAAFTSLMTPENPFVADALEYSREQQPQKTGKFWQFWNNLLNTVDRTGETIGEFKRDVSGIPPETEFLAYQAQAQRARSNSIFMAAGAVVLILVLILIFKK